MLPLIIYTVFAAVSAFALARVILKVERSEILCTRVFTQRCMSPEMNILMLLVVVNGCFARMLHTASCSWNCLSSLGRLASEVGLAGSFFHLFERCMRCMRLLQAGLDSCSVSSSR
jgi:hypothetical protein